MQPTTTFTMLLPALLSHTLAKSVPRGTDMVEIMRHDASDATGSIIWYGAGQQAKPISKRLEHGPYDCSVKNGKDNNKVQCGSKDYARNELCQKLIDDLAGNGYVPVDRSPRKVCWQGNEGEDYANKCCVSWSEYTDGFNLKASLSDLANRVQKQCTTDGVTGQVLNTFVGGMCMNFCLSSNGDHCG